MRRVRILLLSVFLIAFFVFQFIPYTGFALPFYLKYFYYYKNSEKALGMLLLKKEGHQLLVNYYNTEDLPFYAPFKKIFFNNKDQIIAVQIKKEIYRIHYNLNKFSKHQLRKLAVYNPKNKILISEENKRFYITLDKYPVFTVDFLIYFLYKYKKIPSQFYIFEPYKKIILKSFSKKENNLWKIFIKKHDKKIILFEICCSSEYPLYMISGKKQWYFKLKGLGSKEKKTFLVSDLLVDKIIKDLEKNINSINIKKLNFVRYSCNKNTCGFQFIAPVKENFDDPTITNVIKLHVTPLGEYVLKKLENFKKENDWLIFSLTRKKACDIIKDYFEETSSKNKEKVYLNENCTQKIIEKKYKIDPKKLGCEIKKEKKLFFISNYKLYCNGKILDSQDKIIRKLKSYFKNSNIEIKNPHIKNRIIDFDIVYKQKFDIYKFLKSYLFKGIKGHFVEKGKTKEILVKVHKNEILKQKCKSYEDYFKYPVNVETKFLKNRNICMLNLIYSLSKKDIYNRILEILFSLYPDLEWTGEKIIINNDKTIHFYYVKEYKGGYEKCFIKLE